MSAGEYCNREVVIIGRDESLRDAVELFRKYHVGSLVVVEEQRGMKIPVGMVTDRDIVIEVIAEGVDINAVTAGDIMSDRLISVREATSLPDALGLMQGNGVRRVPVVDERGGLLGILTVDGVIELVSEQMTRLTGVITNELRHERQRRA